jgi:hypothetical protein
MKERNWTLLTPYVGQTLVTRDLLTNAIMSWKTAGGSAAKRAIAKRAIVASSVGILTTMAASEAFRMLVRSWIKPEPEDEERERNKKLAMTMMQDVSATLAPFGGDAFALFFGQLFGLAEKKYAESSMVASTLQGIKDSGSLLHDAYETMTGSDDENEVKELKDLSKGAWKATMAITTMFGLPTAGGVDQAMQLIIERAFEPTKIEYKKRSSVSVMDQVDAETTREQFDSMLREEYKQATEEGYIDTQKTSFKEFKNTMRVRVEKKLGKEEALGLGFKKRKPKRDKED